MEFKDYAVALCQTEVSTEGFEVIRLTNACMSVKVMPQLGGKIHSIVNLKTGRDWLWKNSHIALRHPKPDMNYEIELDSGGWDEILFSVAPSRLEQSSGVSLPIGDHGTLVDKAWTQSFAGVNEHGEAICQLYAEGQSPCFRLERRIILDADLARMRLEYTLTNTGQSTWPWFWCAHPLMAIETGMRINVRNGQEIRLADSGKAQSAKDLAWPEIPLSDGRQVDLARIFEEGINVESFCQKFFVQSSGKVSLSTIDGKEYFCMVYDPETLPWLGLWVNSKGWSGCGSEPYLNLGLEPATSPHDALADAVASSHARLLHPGKLLTWSLSVSLESGVVA